MIPTWLRSGPSCDVQSSQACPCVFHVAQRRSRSRNVVGDSQRLCRDRQRGVRPPRTRERTTRRRRTGSRTSCGAAERVEDRGTRVAVRSTSSRTDAWCCGCRASASPQSQPDRASIRVCSVTSGRARGDVARSYRRRIRPSLSIVTRLSSDRDRSSDITSQSTPWETHQSDTPGSGIQRPRDDACSLRHQAAAFCPCD